MCVYTYARVLAWFQGVEEDRPPLDESRQPFFNIRAYFPWARIQIGSEENAAQTRCALSLVYHGRRSVGAQKRQKTWKPREVNAGRNEDVVCKGAALTRLFIAPHMAVACGS